MTAIDDDTTSSVLQMNISLTGLLQIYNNNTNRKHPKNTHICVKSKFTVREGCYWL